MNRFWNWLKRVSLNVGARSLLRLIDFVERPTKPSDRMVRVAFAAFAVGAIFKMLGSGTSWSGPVIVAVAVYLLAWLAEVVDALADRPRVQVVNHIHNHPVSDAEGREGA